jgi:DNA-directed RNA polymerase alpha subunit
MKTTYKEFQEALNIVNNYKNHIEKHYKEVEKQYKEINRFAGVTKETKIMDIYHIIEVRTLNCLHAGGYLDSETKVKDLENVKISELKRLRNFGNKSLEEFKEICFYAGVTLLP